jgi:hypothetical protein
MFTRARSNVVAKPFRMLMLVVALTMLMISLPLDRAHAWSHTAGTGTRGNISLPSIHIGDLYMPVGMTQFTLYGETGPIVYRSPASTGSQTITAMYYVEKWDASSSRWVITAVSPNLLTGQISANQVGVQLAAPYIQPVQARGYFRFSWFFEWRTSTGVKLGDTVIHSNLVADHVCQTPYRLCQSNSGYFQTGGFGTNQW